MYDSVWATAPDADLPIKMGEAGTAAGRPATTVFKVFQKTVESHGDKPALKFKDLSEACMVVASESFLRVCFV